MFKNKSISLLLLWALGLLMVIFLSLPLLLRASKEHVASSETLPDSKDPGNISEAYVFVTIDKKHFLTRFTSYAPQEIQSPVIGVTSGRTVERVVTRIKPAQGKGKVEDFTIKPAPLDEAELNNKPK